MEQDIASYLMYVGLIAPVGLGVVDAYMRIKKRAISAYTSLIETDVDKMNRDQLRALQMRTAKIGLLYDALNLLTFGRKREAVENIDRLSGNINSRLERVTS